MFGRVSKDEFIMDFQWPLSPFQAFACCITSFDSKLACEWTMSYYKNMKFFNKITKLIFDIINY